MGTYATFGGIGASWKKMAQDGSSAGVAVSVLRYSSANGGGWAQHFQNGVITQAQGQNSAIFNPYGPILNMWYHYGAESTWLGWPTAPANCTAGNCTQTFQNGTARSTPDGSVDFVPKR